jgi:hypothetical protein
VGGFLAMARQPAATSTNQTTVRIAGKQQIAIIIPPNIDFVPVSTALCLVYLTKNSETLSHDLAAADLATGEWNILN